MGECSADISVDFEESGGITFSVDTGECTDSAGRFDFNAIILREDGTSQTLEKRETWNRTHNSSRVEVGYSIDLEQDEKLSEVTVLNIECNCYM